MLLRLMAESPARRPPVTMLEASCAGVIGLWGGPSGGIAQELMKTAASNAAGNETNRFFMVLEKQHFGSRASNKMRFFQHFICGFSSSC